MQLHCRGLFASVAFLSTVLLVIACSASNAAVGNSVDIAQDSKMPNLWTIRNAKVQVLVDSGTGRISSYGFRDGANGTPAQNVFWHNAEPQNPKYQMDTWTNYGGDKIWPWPQSLFSWPPPEPKAYSITVDEKAHALIMTSAELAGYGVRIIRKIELAENSSTLVVTSSFEPVGTAPVKPLGVWSITQVPTPNNVFVRIPLTGDRTRYLNRTKPDAFLAKPAGEKVVQLTGDPVKGGKTFLDADIIVAVYDDVAFIQRQLPVQTEGVWAPDERAQIYAHPIHADNIPKGPSYYELEWTAPPVSAAAAQKAPLKVVYKLVKLDKKTTSDEIVKMIEKLP